MKKNKIIISIFASVCVISIIVGYSLIKKGSSNNYGQLAVMTQQDDGTYIGSNMSTFGNDDTDKCTIYLKKKVKTIIDLIKASAKTTKLDFTQVVPKYKVGENFMVNHVYEGYTNVVQEDWGGYGFLFTYNATTKQWEAPTEYDSYVQMTFNINENKENLAICYDSGFNGYSYIIFSKNNTSYYSEDKGGQSCIKIGDVTTEDTLGFNFYAGNDEPVRCNKFNFYLVDNFTINDSESGVYTMEDDYGTSYYFRGNVENNYVLFGDMYWRIVRLNGDGSLRIIYYGGADDSVFNPGYNDNAYVGYMYGDINGSTYKEVHANTNSSTIKTYLDSWYEEYIVNQGLDGDVSDTLFCNDRSVASGTGISGYTEYGAYARVKNGEDPILTCPQKNDAFTANDTTNGNGALTYPIGLLTADEYRLAGGSLQTSTVNNYLNIPGAIWWLGSPSKFEGSIAGFIVNDTGILTWAPMNDSYSVVPVINLTAEAAKQLKGSGTIDDPYTY